MFHPIIKRQRTRQYMRERRNRDRRNEFIKIINDNFHQNNINIGLTPAIGFSKNQNTDLANSIDSISSDGSIFDTSFIINDQNDDSSKSEFDLTDEDEKIEQFIDQNDSSKRSKPFPSCPLSIFDASRCIILMARQLNLDKNGIKCLLDGIHHICPVDTQLPRTVDALLKTLGKHIF